MHSVHQCGDGKTVTIESWTWLLAYQYVGTLCGMLHPWAKIETIATSQMVEEYPLGIAG